MEELKLLKVIQKEIAKIIKTSMSRNGDIGEAHWPFNPLFGRVIYTDDWYTYLEDNMEKLLSQGISSRIVQSFWGITTHKISKLDKERLINIFLQLIKGLKQVRKDPLARHGNLLTIKSKFYFGFNSKMDLMKEFYPNGSPYLKILMYNLTEVLWFMYHPLGHTIHGPYKLKEGNWALVYDFFDLKPKFADKWRLLIPINNLRVIEIYEKPINPDFMERWTTKSETPKIILTNYEGDIHKLTNKIEKALLEGYEYVDKLNIIEKIRLHGHQLFYYINSKKYRRIVNNVIKDVDIQVIEEKYKELIEKLKGENPIHKMVGLV